MRGSFEAEPDEDPHKGTQGRILRLQALDPYPYRPPIPPASRVPKGFSLSV